MLVFFDNEHPGAFGNDESAAIGRKRPRGTRGIVVPGAGHHAHEGETLHDARCKRSIGPPGEQRGKKTELDLAESVTEGIGGRSASGADDVTHATQAEA